MTEAVSFTQSFQSAMDTVARVTPKILVFLIVLVVGWIVARLIARAVTMILNKVHFDKIAERGVVGDALRRSEYDATGLVSKLFYYAVLLITLQVAFGVFGPNPISNLLKGVVSWLPKAAVAIIIVVIASAVAHAVKDIVSAALSSTSYGRMLANLASIFIIGIGAIAALNQVGIATTVTQPILIAVLATVGAILAIGVGGGLVRPMQERWERMLTGAEREATSVRGAYARGREDAERGEATPVETTMENPADRTQY